MKLSKPFPVKKLEDTVALVVKSLERILSWALGPSRFDKPYLSLRGSPEEMVQNRVMEDHVRIDDGHPIGPADPNACVD
jgi:hypothetical protein